MLNSGGLHDTYHVVAHFHWLLGLSISSAVFLVLTNAVRRWSPSLLAQRLRRTAISIWLLGLALTLAATLATYAINEQQVIDRLWLLQLLYNAPSVAASLLLLATLFCCAMICAAIGHHLFRPNN